MTIAKSGSDYIVNVNASIDGKDVCYTYTGPISIIDETYAPGGDEDDDPSTGGDVSDRSSYEQYSFSGFTQAEMDYLGDGDGYYYWALYFADANINLEELSGTGKLLCVELATTVKDTENVPAGDYVINAEAGDYVAFGIYEDSGYAYGTLYAEGDDIPVGATAGNVKVSRSGSTYEIDALLYDDDYATTFSGSYSGPMSYLDLTAETVAQSKKPAMQRRAVLPQPSVKKNRRH